MLNPVKRGLEMSNLTPLLGDLSRRIFQSRSFTTTQPRLNAPVPPADKEPKLPSVTTETSLHLASLIASCGLYYPSLPYQNNSVGFGAMSLFMLSTFLSFRPKPRIEDAKSDIVKSYQMDLAASAALYFSIIPVCGNPEIFSCLPAPMILRIMGHHDRLEDTREVFEKKIEIEEKSKSVSLPLLLSAPANNKIDEKQNEKNAMNKTICKL